MFNTPKLLITYLKFWVSQLMQSITTFAATRLENRFLLMHSLFNDHLFITFKYLLNRISSYDHLRILFRVVRVRDKLGQLLLAYTLTWYSNLILLYRLTLFIQKLGIIVWLGINEIRLFPTNKLECFNNINLGTLFLETCTVGALFDHSEWGMLYKPITVLSTIDNKNLL